MNFDIKQIGFFLTGVVSGSVISLMLVNRAWASSLLSIVILIIVITQFFRASRSTSKTADEDGSSVNRIAVLPSHLNIPVLEVTQSGLIRCANRSARDVFGAVDVLSQPPSELLKAINRDSIGQGTVATFEAQGRVRTFFVFPLLSNELTQFLLIDVEAEMQATEARSLNDTLQVLSHEIMNSLAPIVSMTEVLLEAPLDPNDGNSEDAVRLISDRAKHLMRFVESYRALAKVPPPDKKPVRVSVLLDEIRLFASSRWGPKGVQIIVKDLSRDALLSVDRDLIIQAFNNLINNGAESALINRHSETTPYVSVTARRASSMFHFDIIDSGPGVSYEYGDKVFEAFYSTKPDGTGIGLALAKHIFAAHGARLKLTKQNPGYFTIDLPYRGNAAFASGHQIDHDAAEG